MLKDKTIVFGVCGGIAVYKSVELLRLLVKAGAKVHVIMTRSACEFVTPLTFQTLSGHPVHTELFNLLQEMEIVHITLADRADLFIVAPATANLVGKLAGGIADDLLTTTLMATKAPVLLVPAMNVNMYENRIYQRNEMILREAGYNLLEPDCGYLACGWEGKGKMPAPATIVEHAAALLAPKDLLGETILVTAGPTREAIDPVRYISNHSSGKMGYAIARAAQQRGARVILVSGPVAIPAPVGVELVNVVTAEEMRQSVLARLDEATVVVKAAAVADYRAAEVCATKIKKGRSESMTLPLIKNADILAEIGAMKGERLVVGFAAETTDLLENARKKLIGKNLDMIVANDVSEEGAGFDVETNRVRFLFPDGEVETLPLLDKNEVAQRLLDRIARLRGH
ncbi:MAG: bifunctional phosphopantothenoylcysteine decarboxylase/phosphopantothenate--cysteine ligase CoaBC [Desulfuromonadales bacterium]|nr:bifunctional phosphopantothenoylcysteine decarboxylase/phosphopantothenate--cysteine ligase CoaBC [Desulfuromonadales bacterium]